MNTDVSNQRAHGFRVVYLGTTEVIEKLAADFRRLGIEPIPGIQGEGEAYVLSKALARRLPSDISGHELSAPATA